MSKKRKRTSQATKKRLATFRGVPPEVIRGLHEVPAFAESTLTEQRKMLAFMLKIVNTVASLDRDGRILEQRRENGEMLAEDSRAKRKPITDKRTADLCRLYQKLRKSFDAGGRGNGAALREVCRRYGSLPGREKQITVQAVRDALKRGGVVCK
jgi:hypothetical protein